MSKQSKKLSERLHEEFPSHPLTVHTVSNGYINVLEAVRELEAQLEDAKMIGVADRNPIYEDVLMRNQELRAENERLKGQKAIILDEFVELENERDALRAENEALEVARLQHCERERELRVEVETLRRDVAAAEMGLHSERQCSKYFMGERDEARAELADKEGAYHNAWKMAHDMADERDAALAKLDAQLDHSMAMDGLSGIVIEQRDTALAKLAAVRGVVKRLWAMLENGLVGPGDEMLLTQYVCGLDSAILDGAPKANEHVGSSFDSFLEEEGLLEETTAVAKQVVEEWKGAMAELHDDTEVVTREVVLMQSGYGPAQYVALAEHIKHEHPSLELARATVTFKVPRKAEIKLRYMQGVDRGNGMVAEPMPIVRNDSAAEVKRSLAERLAEYMESGFTRGSGSALLAEVRAMESKVTK